MPRGGARINSGPPPDPNALRRDRASDKDGWVTLPADGRRGKPPAWPLPADIRLTTALEIAEHQREILSAQLDQATQIPKGIVAKMAKLDQQIAELRARIDVAAGREAELWKDLWRTPQAIMWERLKWTREVALYVRWQVHAELGDIDAAKEARQWSDRLGLNPAALLRIRWRIVDDKAAAKPRPVDPRAKPGSMKDRLKVVAGGSA